MVSGHPFPNPSTPPIPDPARRRFRLLVGTGLGLVAIGTYWLSIRRFRIEDFSDVKVPPEKRRAITNQTAVAPAPSVPAPVLTGDNDRSPPPPPVASENTSKPPQ